MNKYIVLVSQELNGHASAESYYVESEKDYTLSQLYEIVFSEEIENYEVEIEHEKEDVIYGRTFGDSFSMTMKKIGLVKDNILYSLYTYTG
jgi:hypothetical protein